MSQLYKLKHYELSKEFRDCINDFCKKNILEKEYEIKNEKNFIIKNIFCDRLKFKKESLNSKNINCIFSSSTIENEFIEFILDINELNFKLYFLIYDTTNFITNFIYNKYIDCYFYSNNLKKNIGLQ